MPGMKAMVMPGLGMSPMKGTSNSLNSMQHMISGMIKPAGMPKVRTKVKTKVKKINLMKKGLGKIQYARSY